eukprot:2674035-Karenia_brevis.AAC.1
MRERESGHDCAAVVDCAGEVQLTLFLCFGCAGRQGGRRVAIATCFYASAGGHLVEKGRGSLLSLGVP